MNTDGGGMGWKMLKIYEIGKIMIKKYEKTINDRNSNNKIQEEIFTFCLYK